MKKNICGAFSVLALSGLPLLAQAQSLNHVDVNSQDGWVAMHSSNGLKTEACVAGVKTGELTLRSDIVGLEILSMNDQWHLSPATKGNLTLKAGKY